MGEMKSRMLRALVVGICFAPLTAACVLEPGDETGSSDDAVTTTPAALGARRGDRPPNVPILLRAPALTRPSLPIDPSPVAVTPPQTLPPPQAHPACGEVVRIALNGFATSTLPPGGTRIVDDSTEPSAVLSGDRAVDFQPAAAETPPPVAGCKLIVTP
jgi:hypothetical protein